MILLVIGVILLTAVRGQPPPLRSYNVDRNAISVSGFSSGGCFAMVFHVAYSSSIMGTGIFAGAPYLCSNTGGCYPGSSIDMDEILRLTDDYSARGRIDNVSNLRNNRPFIWQGQLDSTTHPGAAPRIQEFYQNYQSTVNMNDRMDAGHGQPTLDYGTDCDATFYPWINRCNYDGAFHSLNHIYGGNLQAPTGDEIVNGDFLEFDQQDFATGLDGDSFDEDGGWVYVPTGCRDGSTACRLHVAFHGCGMGRASGGYGDTFARNTGYNEVGELNNIIILYPQIVADIIKGNPRGCWDWWGYEDDVVSDNDFATQEGVQNQIIKRMIDRASGASD